MIFIKYIKPDKGRQEYHYQCISCEKISIKPQKTDQATDYCQTCWAKSEEAKILNPRLHVGPKRDVDSNGKIIYHRVCDTCKAPFTTTLHREASCTSCGKFKRPKLEHASSDYIGVCFIKPRRKEKYGTWLSNSKFQGKLHNYAKYKENCGLTDQQMQDLCAIQRDIGLRKFDLPNTRNFTDEELSEMLYEYTKIGLI